MGFAEDTVTSKTGRMFSTFKFIDLYFDISLGNSNNININDIIQSWLCIEIHLVRNGWVFTELFNFKGVRHICQVWRPSGIPGFCEHYFWYSLRQFSCFINEVILYPLYRL